jgi:predicted dehydrogenase
MIGVAVVGAGLIGARRAEQAHLSARSRLVAVSDAKLEIAQAVAQKYGAIAAPSWQEVISRSDVGAVVIATPNAFLKEIAIAALEAGKHVLIEKPMGRNLTEAEAMAACARRVGRKFKVGFNHRYHPAIRDAYRLFRDGVIGDLISIRARYGHGGRPGYEKEWRGNAELAGGGELTDQGVHVLDLIQWFAGTPKEAFAYLQTAIWPIAPLEDSAFAMLKFDSGMIAQFHTAWTQWKNLFSFELFGNKGSLVIEGLGKSYGQETLSVARRKPQGGAPYMERTAYDDEDLSWAAEWEDFARAIEEDGSHLGTAEEGVRVMRMLDALYRASSANRPVEL